MVISTFPALSANFSASMLCYCLWPETGEVSAFKAFTHFFNLGVGFRIYSSSPNIKLCQWLFHQVLVALNSRKHLHHENVVESLVIEVFKLGILVLPTQGVEVENQLVYYTVSDTERCLAEEGFKAVGCLSTIGIGLTGGCRN